MITMAGAFSRFDPFAELSALQKQLFSEGIFGQGRRQMPTTDIYTEDDSKLTYYRRIVLPEQADEEAVEASFTDGVLRVTVPYKAIEAPRRIPITKGGSSEKGGSDG